MNLSINSVSNEKSYASIKTPKSQNNKDTQKVEDSSKDTQNTHKKKQIISEQEGKFYCKYMVDDDGSKVLLSKVPIAQVKEPNSLNESNEINVLHYNGVSTTRAAFEYKQQQRHLKSNSQEIMDILNGNLGIQNNSNSKLFD